MHYYVWKDENGDVIGWHETKNPYNNLMAIEVSQKEYVALGGNPKTINEPAVNPPVDQLAETNQDLTEKDLAIIELNQAVTDLELRQMEE